MSAAVSVVIPCYNHRPFIEQAVRSVLEQEPPPAEVCVVDDGSQDGSREAVCAFGGRVRLLRHEGGANRGAAASLNAGIAATTAPLIAFLDSDDYWYQGKLAKQVQVLEQRPDVGVVHTDGDVVDERGGRLYGLYPDGFPGCSDPLRLLVDNFIRAGMSSVLVRRSCMELAGPFDTELRWAKDHDMWLRLMERTEFAFVSEPLLAYRRHGTNISLARGQWEDCFRVLARAIERYPYPRRHIRARRAVLEYRLADFDWRSGKRRQALSRLVRAAALDPWRAVTVVLRGMKP